MMPEAVEGRVGKLESRLDGHLAVIHRFIDELREERVASQKRFAQNEEMIRRLIDMQAEHEETTSSIVEMQGNILRVMDKLDNRLGNHKGRISSAGL